MTGRYLRVLFATLTLLALAGSSEAARRSSLSGNLLIQDTDDIFFFPHLIGNHNRMVTFDFGSSATVGSGGLVFGNESLVFGAFMHRSDFLGALPDAFLRTGDVETIGRQGQIDVGVGPNALNWVDVLLGWQLADSPWGVRFSLGRNNQDPPDPMGSTVSADVTAFDVIVGTRLAQFATDVAVEFAYASAEDNNIAPPPGVEKASPFQVGVGVRRTSTEDGDALQLGWLGLFDWSSATVDQTPPMGVTSSSDVTSFDLVAGVGPLYRPNDRTNVAMYGTFEFQRDKTESPLGMGTATSTSTEIAIPGWNIAGEFDLASWLQFRAGMRSRFVFVDDHQENTVTPSDTHDKSNRLDYGWTTGLGVTVGGLQFDGFLNPDVITSGTDLLGESGDLFALVSGTYRF